MKGSSCWFTRTKRASVVRTRPMLEGAVAHSHLAKKSPWQRVVRCRLDRQPLARRSSQKDVRRAWPRFLWKPRGSAHHGSTATPTLRVLSPISRAVGMALERGGSAHGSEKRVTLKLRIESLSEEKPP